MGLTQHKNAVANIQRSFEFIAFGRSHRARWRRAIARCAATPTCRATGRWASTKNRNRGFWTRSNANSVSRRRAMPGLTLSIRSKRCTTGRAKFFFAMGGNFLSATPDTVYTAQALRKCNLTVHVSTKLNRAHLVTGKRALFCRVWAAPKTTNSERAAVRVGRKLDGRGSRFDGARQTGVGISKKRTGHRRPSWRTRFWAKNRG